MNACSTFQKRLDDDDAAALQKVLSVLLLTKQIAFNG